MSEFSFKTTFEAHLIEEIKRHEERVRAGAREYADKLERHAKYLREALEKPVLETSVIAGIFDQSLQDAVNINRRQVELGQINQLRSTRFRMRAYENQVEGNE